MTYTLHRPIPRRVAVLASIVSIALLVSGCSGGGGGGSSSGDNGASPDEGGTLVYASWEWAEPTRGAQIWDALQAYTKLHPKVTLQQKTITRADYEKTISTQLGAGGGPDVMIIPDPFLPTLEAANSLEPLNPAITAEITPALTSSNDSYKVDGKQLALVWETSNYALFWNKAILDQAGVKPPTTVAELVTAAQTIKKVTGKTGFAVRHQMNEETAWWTDFSNWPAGYGGSWSKDGKLTINSAENIAGVNALKQVYESGAFAIGDDASTYRSKFGAGDIAMIIDNSNIPFSIAAKNTVVPSSQIGASALPFPTPDSVHVANLVGVNANSKNKAIALDFVHWMYSSAAQQSLANALFPSAPGTSVKPDASLISANPWYDPFYAQGPNSRSAIIPGFETQTQPISSIILSQVSRVLTSGVSAQEAMDAAQKEAAALGR